MLCVGDGLVRLLLVALLFTIMAVAALPVPTVDHWSSATSKIRGHMRSMAPDDDSSLVAQPEAESSAQGGLGADSLVGGTQVDPAADGMEGASSNVQDGSLPSVDDTQPTAASRRTDQSSERSSGSNGSEDVREVPTKHPHTLIPESEMIDMEFEKLFRSKKLFEAFLEDMEHQEAQRASQQGELVDVRCPATGGQCETIFASKAKL